LDGFRASCHFAGTVVAKALSQASRPSGGQPQELGNSVVKLWGYS
jgi:hypothetical protein